MFNLKQSSPLALPCHDHCIQLSPCLLQFPLQFLNLSPLALNDSLISLYLRPLNVTDHVHLRELGLPRPDLPPYPRYLILPRSNVTLHLR